MKELHLSISAVGAHLDQEIEELVAQRSRKKDQGDRRAEHTDVAKADQQESRLSDADFQTEEMMRLGQ